MDNEPKNFELTEDSNNSKMAHCSICGKQLNHPPDDEEWVCGGCFGNVLLDNAKEKGLPVISTGN